MVPQSIAISLVITTVLVGANACFGCECTAMDICQRVEKMPVIFLGEVIEGGLDPGQDAWTGTASFAKLRVIEAFRGLPANTHEVMVELSFMPGMCSSMQYRKGETTLVFVSPEESGALSDGGCTQSRFAADAKEDLEYVRRYFQGKARTTLRGRVGSNMRASLVDFVLDQDQSGGLPVSGATVIAEADGRRYSTHTDTTGRYELMDVPPGSYSVHAELDGYANKDDPGEPNGDVDVAERGCAIKNLSLWSQNSLGGSVIGPDRRPIPNLAVFLQKANPGKVDQPDEWGAQETTNERGEFIFKEIDPGGHYLVVSPHGATPDSPFPTGFYGNSPDREHAKVIDIGSKSKLTDYVIVVNPAIPTRTLRVHLTDSEGRPVSETEVQCAESGPSDGVFRPLTAGKSDIAGVALCNVLSDRAYKISATKVKSPFPSLVLETGEVDVLSGTKDEEIHLQMRP